MPPPNGVRARMQELERVASFSGGLRQGARAAAATPTMLVPLQTIGTATTFLTGLFEGRDRAREVALAFAEIERRRRRLLRGR